MNVNQNEIKTDSVSDQQIKQASSDSVSHDAEMLLKEQQSRGDLFFEWASLIFISVLYLFFWLLLIWWFSDDVLGDAPGFGGIFGFLFFLPGSFIGGLFCLGARHFEKNKAMTTAKKIVLEHLPLATMLTCLAMVFIQYYHPATLWIYLIAIAGPVGTMFWSIRFPSWASALRGATLIVAGAISAPIILGIILGFMFGGGFHLGH